MPPLQRPQIINAISDAHRLRLRGGFAADQPVSVYDLAAKLGVTVWFISGNSFGGMYTKAHGQILVPTKRPPGRQAYTCAHELGHWHFRHGSRIDVIEELDKGGSDDPDERMANLFAAHLLMPQLAVLDALRRRSIAAAKITPIGCYRVANQLGVGYLTLVRQLERLRLIGNGKAESLLETAPKDIRKAVLGASVPGHLIMADPHWCRVPIDLTVGNALVVSTPVRLSDDNLRVVGTTAYGVRLEAIKPGIMRLSAEDSSWTAEVRIARQGYAGLSKYRFLEDPDVN